MDSTATSHSAAAPETVLMLGNYRPTLAVARALHAAGYRIMTGLGGGEGGTEVSRHVQESWAHPDPADDSVAFAHALTSLLTQRTDIRYVFPITEAFAIWFAEHPKALSGQARLVSPAAATVLTCADKLTMFHLAHQVGVETLPYACVTDAPNSKSLLDTAKRVGFPVVVKSLAPGRRLGTRKALIARTPAELEQALRPADVSALGSLVVQRQAQGTRHNLYFAARNGKLLAAVETKIHRTDRLDGTGLAVDGITVPTSDVVAEATSRLIAALDYTGIGLAQLIVGPNQEICFLEINARVAGSHAVTEASGLPLSAWAIELARDQPKPRRDLSTTGRTNIRYAWTYGDLRGLKCAYLEGEVSARGALVWFARLMRTLLLARTHMTWRLTDPMPTLYLFSQLIPGLKAIVKHKSPQAPERQQGSPALPSATS